MYITKRKIDNYRKFCFLSLLTSFSLKVLSSKSKQKVPSLYLSTVHRDADKSWVVSHPMGCLFILKFESISGMVCVKCVENRLMNK